MLHLSRFLSSARTTTAIAVLAALAGQLLAQTSQQASVLVSATVASSPPAITFTWPSDPTATSYSVYRRLPGSPAWSTPVTVPGGGAATTWTDNNVLLGLRYEYWFNKLGTVAGRNVLTAAIDAVPFESRGTLILIVDATKVAGLGSRLDRLITDMTGDGWRVLRHDVLPSASVVSVKALIAADVAANPLQARAVFLLGHVPVPYSGQLAPDGHPDHQGAWPADLYYGELNGPWTDTSVNTTSASRPENRNIPGDGKFDQTIIPSDVDLAVGRVDLANMSAFAASEDVLLQQYLDKNHDYRQKVFAADQRAVIDDNFGWFSGEAFAASGWRNFSSLVGPTNVTAADYFTTLNTPTGNGYVWSYGCGGGSYTSAGGIGSTTDFATSSNRSVFTMLFGSYFGDWDVGNSFLRAPLCSGWTLANAWAGRPHWSFHSMAFGESIGACAKLSQNDTSMGGYGGRFIHVALMGDPTLRQHVIAPATAVAIVDVWPQANITWMPSLDAVAGYHVYRSASPTGPFTRLTPSAVAATAFTDPAPLVGFATYMVRALRLETTPTGTYWNLSQGAFATECLPAAAHTSYGAGCDSLLLSASPAPVSTPSNGTLVTYTIDNIPEASPSSGTYFGVTIVSLTPDLAGTSLAYLGMPLCSFYVGTLDVTYAFVGTSATQTTSFQIPAGVGSGTEVFATAAAFTAPGLLNAFGASTSNGVRSFVNHF